MKTQFFLQLLLILFLTSSRVCLGQVSESKALTGCKDGNTKVLVNTAVWGLTTKTYITGLTSDKFRLSGENENYQIQCFSEVDEPLTLGFVIDFSSSVKKSSIEAGLEGIKEFVNASNAQNVYFVVGFDSQPYTLLEPTSNRENIDQFLRDAALRDRKGRSSLNDSLESAVRRFPQDSDGRKILIIVSDGRDNYSKTSENAIVKGLREAGIRAFTASIVDSSEAYIFTEDRMSGDRRLNKIAYETGGSNVVGTEKTGLANYFRRIAKLIRNEYILGFSPPKIERKWRPLKFEVKVAKDFEKIRLAGAERFFY